MIPVTADSLEVIYPVAKRSRIDLYTPWLNAAMEEFDIVTPERQAAFLATVGWESGQLRYTRELYSGEKYDTGTLAKALGNTPEADGDGQLHRGVGLIQLTGAANHKSCADYFGISFEDIVGWLQTPEGASRSAAWFWSTHGCNELADAGDFRAVTKRVNGGYNGYNQRVSLWNSAKAILV